MIEARSACTPSADNAGRRHTVSEEQPFRVFIDRIRAGDNVAAAELVERFGAAIRLEVRMRMRDRRLNRLFDSGDVCQSVLASFFVRAALGQYDLENDQDVIKLLARMAHNKIASQARKHRNLTRDARRVVGDLGELAEVAGGPTPSRIVVGREILQLFRQHMTDEERRLADGRALGRPWAEIVAEVGGTPEARSKQLARALDRIGRELGLDELDG
jgi:RNA polymerase sigma-70 factor (ECF subfamily)